MQQARRKNRFPGPFLLTLACGTRTFLSMGAVRVLPNITRKGKIPALSLLNFDVAACVAIFWL
jgi:hypothetical protein